MICVSNQTGCCTYVLFGSVDCDKPLCSIACVINPTGCYSHTQLLSLVIVTNPDALSSEWGIQQATRYALFLWIDRNRLSCIFVSVIKQTACYGLYDWVERNRLSNIFVSVIKQAARYGLYQWVDWGLCCCVLVCRALLFPFVCWVDRNRLSCIFVSVVKQAVVTVCMTESIVTDSRPFSSVWSNKRLVTVCLTESIVTDSCA